MKIVLINTFFDGYDFWDTRNPTLTWLLANVRSKFPGFRKFLNKHFNHYEAKHPIEDIITKQDPDLIIATETIPALPSLSLQSMSKHSYYFTIGYDNYNKLDIKRAVTIASKLPLEQLTDFDHQDNKHHGGACVVLHEHRLIIIGVHPSAYSKKHRLGYLRYIEEYTRKTQSLYPGYNVITAGDFNCEPQVASKFFPNFKAVTAQTFPSLELYDLLHNPLWSWLRSYLGIQKKRLGLDQFYADNKIIINSAYTIETLSDHSGLVVDIKS